MLTYQTQAIIPPRPCLGCGMPTRNGSRCMECAATFEARKGSYGAAWRRLRARFLAAHPLCSAPGCTARATEVDHKLPRTQGGTDDERNLQGLCHHHHSQKTVTCDGGLVW
jgi:5-methylcytosine-specific restriction protein A